MTSKDLIDACDILIKLQDEFSTEEAKLSEISDDHAVRIDELDQQITTFRRNDDVDFRVFSPRNVSTGTSEKIVALENEKKQLEREKKDADKQLKYYSGKTAMIEKVLNILRGDLKEQASSDDPFAFINDEEPSEVESASSDNDYDDVAELFRDHNTEPADNDVPVSDSFDSSDDTVTDHPMGSVNGIPVDEIERVCHKVEFCEKIISNDGIRARLEIKNIAADLNDLIRAYGK